MLIVSLLMIVVGCRTAHYRAATMPDELRVRPTPPSRDLDLASMVAPGTGTNQLSPGDLVQITIASGKSGEEIEPSKASVKSDGTLDAPPIGAVAVAGLEPFEAERRLEEAAIERGVFVRPAVTLEVLTPAVNRISVLGAVKEPKVVELPKGSSDLARALAAAGGLTEEAGTKIDVLRYSAPTFIAGQQEGESVRLASMEQGAGSRGRGDGTPGSWLPAPRSIRIDLAQASGNRNRQEFALADRDVVMVLPHEKQFIHVTGLVRDADQFELPPNQDVTVLGAIAMAGGVSSPVADKVYVIRRLPDMPEPAVIQVSLAEAKRNGNEDLRLASGDLVSVERTMSTVMVDSVMTMFRVGFSVGGNLVAF